MINLSLSLINQLLNRRKQSHGEGMSEEMGLMTFMFAVTNKQL
jgi:hypothetical protein